MVIRGGLTVVVKIANEIISIANMHFGVFLGDLCTGGIVSAVGVQNLS